MTLKIAMLGTRGVPASYSGFETCVEQLGKRLVERGNDVTVFCRSHHITYDKPEYLGMKLVKHGTIANKYLDTIVHSFVSSLHVLFMDFDIALYFIAGNSPVTWIPRLAGVKSILNVDGLDWKREKWPPLAKKYIQLAEYLATKLPNQYLTDSRVVQNYYQEKFGDRPPYVPYGSEILQVQAGALLEKFDLEPRKYILFVGRLVPENYAHHLVSAFRTLKTNMKCVIVGDAAYADTYKAELRRLAENDNRIIFTGYVFGQGYHELGSNAYAFVETSGVGGTHPALVEAMAFGNAVITHDTAENLETIGDAGFAYNGQKGAESLALVLDKLISNPRLTEEFRQKALARAHEYYSWETVTDAYELMFYQILKRPIPKRLQLAQPYGI